MESKLVGRDAERHELLGVMNTEDSELIAVTGRRRIGKTFLVKETYGSRLSFYYTGINNASKQEQLKEFTKKLADTQKVSFPVAQVNDWLDAFSLLKKYLQTLRVKKPVIFLDEFPWMASHRSGFLGAFEYFWNDWAAYHNVVVVICGSATSWMIRHIMNNKGGLHNRVTRRIHLDPFSLYEVELYFKAHQIKLPRYQIVQLYMVLGGVPFYLQQVAAGESAAQTIDRICFAKNGLLRDEFSNLYRALFENYETYEEIIRSLATKRKGLTRKEIIAITSLTNGGGLTRMLNELEESSFIETYLPFEKKKRDALYRLVDEYSVFYLNFIERNRKAQAGYWLQMSQTSKYISWSGFAYENVILKHILSIKNKMGIASVATQQSSFVFKGNKTNPGFQIDLIIARADDTIHICEIKFSKDPFILKKKDAAAMQRRRAYFRDAVDSNLLLVNTLITTHEPIMNEHVLAAVEKIVTMEALFLAQT